jgi:hypothetical protein
MSNDLQIHALSAAPGSVLSAVCLTLGEFVLRLLNPSEPQHL